MSLYLDWMAQASVTPHRIDMGVDYAGSGYWTAIGDGEVGPVVVPDPGWYGNYMQYQLTSPGDLQGLVVYHAEGITPLVRQGDRVRAGQRIAQLIPGWYSATESGVGVLGSQLTWAVAYGGGFDGTHSTNAGVWFSELTVALGGVAGVLVPPSSGSRPPFNFSGISGGPGAPSSGGPTPMPPINPGPAADWSDRVEHAWGSWGLHGRRARNNALFVEQLLRDTRYVTTTGPR